MENDDLLNGLQSNDFDSGNDLDPTEFLFNQSNTDEFKNAVNKGISVIQKKLEQVEHPFTGIKPHQLAEKFSTLNLNQNLNSIDEALTELETLYLKDAIYFHRPKYVAHLNCPVVYPAILAELILSSINSSMDTWDQSAGATLIEQSLIDWACQRVGFSHIADGIFTSGGTQSNLMALLLARDHYCEKNFPTAPPKHRGLPPFSHKFRIFTSEVSHFSVQKSAAILGLGYDSVIPIPCDNLFRLNSKILEKKIDQTKKDGLIPIAVIATAGTTDFGSLDPLNKIADLCDAHKLWMHTDAAYGCGLLVSNQHRQKLNGIERSNSVTIDFHKSFYQPVSCGAFLVKDSSLLSIVTHHAEYLNPLSQSLEGTPNLVNKSIQTTRRFDALKLWLSFRIIGVKNLGKMFDTVILLAQKTYELMANDNVIEVAHQPELSTLVFRYSPANIHYQSREEVNRLNEDIRKRLFAQGHTVIASTKIKETRFLKFTLLNPATTIQDLSEVINLIKICGEEILLERLSIEQKAG